MELSSDHLLETYRTMRTIRSFDPCMPCTTHIHTENRVISRDVVTCACGVDEDHEH